MRRSRTVKSARPPSPVRMAHAASAESLLISQLYFSIKLLRFTERSATQPSGVFKPAKTLLAAAFGECGIILVPQKGVTSRFITLAIRAGHAATLQPWHPMAQMDHWTGALPISMACAAASGEGWGWFVGHQRAWVLRTAVQAQQRPFGAQAMVERAAPLPPRATVNSRLSSNSNCQGSMVPLRMSMFSGLQGSKGQGGSSNRVCCRRSAEALTCSLPPSSAAIRRLACTESPSGTSCLQGRGSALPHRDIRCRAESSRLTAAWGADAMQGSRHLLGAPTQRTRRDNKLLAHASRAVGHLDLLRGRARSVQARGRSGRKGSSVQGVQCCCAEGAVACNVCSKTLPTLMASARTSIRLFGYAGVCMDEYCS